MELTARQPRTGKIAAQFFELVLRTLGALVVPVTYLAATPAVLIQIGGNPPRTDKRRAGLARSPFLSRSSADCVDRGITDFKPPGMASQHIEAEAMTMEFAQVEPERCAR